MKEFNESTMIKICSALLQSKQITPQGLVAIIKEQPNFEICLQVMTGTYEYEKPGTLKVDEDGIVWELVNEYPIQRSFLCKSEQKKVWAESFEEALEGNYKTYAKDDWYEFIIDKESTRTYSSYGWEQLTYVEK